MACVVISGCAHHTPRTSLTQRGQGPGGPGYGDDVDQVGNWTAFKNDAGDGGTWDLNQSRTHNDANEISDISRTAGPDWIDPDHDMAGGNPGEIRGQDTVFS